MATERPKPADARARTVRSDDKVTIAGFAAVSGVWHPQCHPARIGRGGASSRGRQLAERVWLRVIGGVAEVVLLSEPAWGRIDGQRGLYEWRDR
jgi:hypothetical protein